ncbi:bifunctional DNA-binding transcriptional regulator/O6-methylguanine-DNA methyltransferase Ada [Falsiroseomonas selenitidurans]|uniref:Bifunctional DNA-binding transcriptional regulator/O6-methylguanine-DNA methyltransferase Ada n=1 Tax=Falsiroseomonas selenitidurans TaxID=2716335 RepID=A0ABX1EBG8_9PROT|nr:bifunctional DNA-binding transcriptional regulator/O6-methylguanine-DNA methyltransferase Ada [Falsiroseomonas selenitidurans]NKC34346.1 bifunctional DNA-binding transcriptional regulator/O6-methylguanine-DNA methyltransferase Ada [Falsiroseomonas selenitidurans]
MPEAPIDLDALRWQAVLDRVAAPDCGGFLYAVTTQGVFCRPGCPARPPLRRNTRFFADARAAEAEGFRACKRCDPKGERAALHAAAVQAACDLIEQAEAMPSLAALAACAGYARHHFLRLFRDVTGVTPRSYAEGVRARRLQAALAAGDRVAEAVAGAGFGSESRVYEDTGRHLGMTPGAARRGGAGEVIRIAHADSAMGPLLVGATEAGICFIGFAEPPAALEGDLRARFPQARVEPAAAALAEAVRAVVGFLAEPAAALALPLDLRGTAFQRRVWEALTRIPLGETRTYAGLAAEMGMPAATRAVARACARNPVSLAVPCHRVVGASGDLTGYRWGVPRKAALLAGERRARRGGAA